MPEYNSVVTSDSGCIKANSINGNDYADLKAINTLSIITFMKDHCSSILKLGTSCISLSSRLSVSLSQWCFRFFSSQKVHNFRLCCLHHY